jgi:ABC-type nitrate/sulfonate/bicarbonate transport system substrate-binding protein
MIAATSEQKRMSRWVRRFAACAAIAALALSSSGVCAEEKLRFGKSLASLFHYTPIDVGIETGIFKKHGFEIETTSFAGDAKLQQALAAGAVDIGVGGGPALAFVAKGSPDLGVAEAAGAPLGATMTVLADSPIKAIADLKGKIVSVSTVGSQTEWMTRELSRQQGWGPDGIKTVALGELPAQIAALKTHQTDVVTADITTAYRLVDSGDGRILVKFGDVIPSYVNSVLYATNDMMANRSEALRQFLAAWFETVAFMKQNKAETVRIAAGVLKIPEPIVSRVYDETARMISPDGRFDRKGLAVLSRSFVEMNMLPAEPELSSLYTEKFLPAP